MLQTRTFGICALQSTAFGGLLTYDIAYSSWFDKPNLYDRGGLKVDKTLPWPPWEVSSPWISRPREDSTQA
ncbi:hypothetical protein V6N13_106756 [Hibiscus sabdariffa]